MVTSSSSPTSVNTPRKLLFLITRKFVTVEKSEVPMSNEMQLKLICIPYLMTIFLFSCFQSYHSTIVEGNVVKPVETKMKFKTERKVGKVGVMLVGLGGNNGT